MEVTGSVSPCKLPGKTLGRRQKQEDELCRNGKAVNLRAHKLFC